MIKNRCFKVNISGKPGKIFQNVGYLNLTESCAENSDSKSSGSENFDRKSSRAENSDSKSSGAESSDSENSGSENSDSDSDSD